MRYVGSICFIAVAVLAASVPAQTFGEVAVIVNKSVPVRSIESAQLLDLYTGDIRMWTNGEPVVVVDLKPDTETKNVFYKFLGKSSSRLKSIWMKNMLAGEGNPPESFTDEQLLLQKVASTPGAIGYVDAATVQKANADVVTLRVIPAGK